MFEVGDTIDYGFYKNLLIIGKDKKHYVLKYPDGNPKKVYIWLIDKHGVLCNVQKEKFLTEYEELCRKYKVFINFSPRDARLEPNPNLKGNETNKELSWLAIMEESFSKLRNNS